MTKPHQWLNQIGVAVTAYNPEGQVIGTWGATYPVFYEFDEYDRMSAMYTLRDTNVVVDSYSSFSSQPSAFDKTTWLYDEAAGLLTNKLYADGKGTSYTYTPDGKLASRIWARGITTTYSYTNTGEMVGINYSDETPAISFTYNRIGQQVTVTDAQGTRTFSYSPTTLALTSETTVAGGVTNVLARSQDSFGRASGFTLGDNYSVSYGFAADGLFDSVDSVVLGVTNNWQYSYLSGSALISHLVESNAGVTNDRSYEANRNLVTEIHNQAQGSTISRFQYENDEIGRRTLRIDNIATTNLFSYNVRSELTGAIMSTNTFSYAFDQIGNRLSASNNVDEWTYLCNALNQYTNITDGVTLNPTYDLDGNMLSDGVNTLTWNGENRLIGVSNATYQASYSYDYMGRRFQKTVVTNSVTNTITFIYDGWLLVGEQSVIAGGDGGNLTNVTQYIWGLDLSGSMQGAGGIGGLLAVIQVSSLSPQPSVYFPSTDANGNITDYVDANGIVVAHREFDPFGNTIVATGPKVNNFHFWFSTHYFVAETDLYNAKNRDYSRIFGRFISQDPIGEMGFERLRDYSTDVTPKKGKYRKLISQHPSKSILGYGGMEFRQILSLAYQAHLQSKTSQANRRLLNNPTLQPKYLYVANNPIGRIDPFGLDSPGCDGIPEAWESPCVLECCAEHDACYDNFGCTSCSWISRLFRIRQDPCDVCNAAVVGCIAGCAVYDEGYDDPNRPNYYCAVHHVWFDDPNSPHMQHSTTP